jgi:hypothetical protein
MADSFAERQSRLVSLVYQVLGTIEPPALESSEGEVLAALASAFHRKAQTTVEAELDTPQGKPALPGQQHVFVERPVARPFNCRPLSSKRAGTP